jgi:outer membrane receptor protein involved in Fe transport
LTWAEAGRSFSLQLRRIGAQFEDDLNQRRLPAATTFDLFGSLPITRSLSLVARGENALNRRVLAALGADGTEERTTPRTLWLGLRLRRPAD